MSTFILLKKSFHIGLLLMVGLGMCGCSREPKGAEYFSPPHNERQTYRVKMIGGKNGTIEGTAILRQEGITDIGGAKYHKSVLTFEGIPGAKSQLVYSRIAADGIHARSSTDPQVADTIEVPFPPDVGRKWIYQWDESTADMKITAVESLDTAEKTYPRCLHIQGKGNRAGVPIEFDNYYAPNVGAVKSTYRKGQVTLEMVLRAP